MLFSKVIKAVWFLICLSGNIYQVGKIANDFFQYQIVTTINVNYPETFILPALSVCLFQHQVSNLEKLIQMNPNWTTASNYTSLSDEEIIHELKNMGAAKRRKYIGMMFNNLTAKQYDDVTYKFDELFSTCILVENDGSTQTVGKCSKLFNIVAYFFGYCKCWSFNFKLDEYKLNFLDSNRADTVPGALYYFRFTPLSFNRTAEAALSFNMNNEYDRIGYFRFAFLSELQNLISLSYEEFSNTLLPFPYVTNCRRYASNASLSNMHAVTDRGTCFESCMMNTTAKYLGRNVILPGMFVFTDTIEKNPNLKMMTYHELLNNKSLAQLKYNWSKECDKMCSSAACEETFYVPNVRSSIEYPDPWALTYVMQSPRIETIVEAKLSFVVFLTNVFSTFGFWIGLSLFSFVDILTDLIMKFVNRKKQTINIQNINNPQIMLRSRHERESEFSSNSNRIPHQSRDICPKCRMTAYLYQKHLSTNYLPYSRIRRHPFLIHQ